MTMNEELTSFDSFSDEIKKGIEKLGWITPMPVQSRVIPLMRHGKDLMVQAVTGSGKTGAFGLPIVEKMDAERKVIQALVLAPTRELASQIATEVTIMTSHTGAETVAGWESLRGWVAGGPQPTVASIQGTCLALAPIFGGPCRFDPTFVIPDMDGRIMPR